jgi:hypothetical protein
MLCWKPTRVSLSRPVRTLTGVGVPRLYNAGARVQHSHSPKAKSTNYTYISEQKL